MQSARSSLEEWVKAAGVSVSKITYADTAAKVAAANLTAFKLLYVPSSYLQTNGGITDALNDALIAIKGKIADFVNLRGACSRRGEVER